MAGSTSNNEPVTMEGKPPAFRVIILRKDGSLVSSQPLNRQTEEQARIVAQHLVKGHDVELWDGLRFIEHYTSDTTSPNR